MWPDYNLSDLLPGVVPGAPVPAPPPPLPPSQVPLSVKLGADGSYPLRYLSDDLDTGVTPVLSYRADMYVWSDDRLNNQEFCGEPSSAADSVRMSDFKIGPACELHSAGLGTCGGVSGANAV